MPHDSMALLLPALTHPPHKDEFNVFEVLHHGTHEKQLSNLFAWLLAADGSHHLGEAFQRMFVDEVNRSLPATAHVPHGPYSVRQEVNTSPTGEAMDIADLVLESDDTVIVVENYYVADGHGHSFEGYEAFGARHGKRSVVVMLCGSKGSADLTAGWDGSVVVTHPTLVEGLVRHVASDPSYAQQNPHQHAFIDQMEQHFVKGRRLNDKELVGFVEAMCASGEAARYGAQKRDDAAIAFADDIREQALERFVKSIELLRSLKVSLFNYSVDHLKGELNQALGTDVIGQVFKNYKGNYEWTVAFYRADTPDAWLVQIKFGPSAWYANENDPHWKTRVPSDEVDYSHLFLTHGTEIRQSTVTMDEVLSGLRPDDSRLRDELLALVNG